MRRGFGALLLAFALAGCDRAADPSDETGAPGVADPPAAGSAEADMRPDAGADTGQRAPRPEWLREDGALEIEGTRYEAEPTVMILDRDRLDSIGHLDGVDLYQPRWAEDPRKRIFAEEEPHRWRPFARVDRLPG